jgi:hypothetical protein
MDMITKDSVEEAYSFFHQKNLYQLMDNDSVRDHIEYTISNYAEAMSVELYTQLAAGKPDFLHDHSNFAGDLSAAVQRLEDLL